MVFAKVILIAAILVVIAFAVLLRVRAWKARRTAKRAAWQAEVDRAIRES